MTFVNPEMSDGVCSIQIRERLLYSNYHFVLRRFISYFKDYYLYSRSLHVQLEATNKHLRGLQCRGSIQGLQAHTYLSSCVFPRETSISGSAEGSRGIECGPREEVVSPTANRALDFTSRGVG